MIVISLLTSQAIPPHVELVMLRMHLPEALIRRTYAARRPKPQQY